MKKKKLHTISSICSIQHIILSSLANRRTAKQIIVLVMARPLLQIVNVVCHAQLICSAAPLDLLLCCNVFDAKPIRHSRLPCMILKTKPDDNWFSRRCTLMIFDNGRLVCMGVTSKEDGFHCIVRLASAVNVAAVADFHVVSTVAVMTLGYAIKRHTLLRVLPNSVRSRSYVHWRRNEGGLATIFASGNVMLHTKDRQDELDQMAAELLPFCELSRRYDKMQE